jgi:hypothetical protein
MIKLLIIAYVTAWASSSAPYYVTAKATNPDHPFQNAAKAFGLSAAWILTVIPIWVTFVKDVIASYKTPTTPTV